MSTLKNTQSCSSRGMEGDCQLGLGLEGGTHGHSKATRVGGQPHGAAQRRAQRMASGREVSCNLPTPTTTTPKYPLGSPTKVPLHAVAGGLGVLVFAGHAVKAGWCHTCVRAAGRPMGALPV